jgi:hypothetical protein
MEDYDNGKEPPLCKAATPVEMVIAMLHLHADKRDHPVHEQARQHLKNSSLAKAVAWARPTESVVSAVLVHLLLDRGYEIRVDDEEETECDFTTDSETIINSLGHTSMNYLICRKARQRNQFIHLIWGNDVDLVSDGSAGDIEDFNAIFDYVSRLGETLNLGAKS